jgi:hypothetical protein
MGHRNNHVGKEDHLTALLFGMGICGAPKHP